MLFPPPRCFALPDPCCWVFALRLPGFGPAPEEETRGGGLSQNSDAGDADFTEDTADSGGY